MYFLIFSSHFDRDVGIDVGRLVLHHLKHGHQKIWMTYSSHAGGQKREGFHKRGGMLPPQYRVKNLPHWTVFTYLEDSKHVKGVEGSFYRINPYEVTTDMGGVRSAFGIHRDANAPGSLGCIVMSDDRFADFENKMRSLWLSGVNELPLVVVYS